MMLERLKPYVISEKAEEQAEFINWVWNSHYWKEYYPGYFQCKWCERVHTSVTGITVEYPMCMKNPVIIKLLALAIDADRRHTE